VGKIKRVPKKHVGSILNHTDNILSKATKKFLLRKSNLCALCGEPILTMKEASIDHVIPLSKGGVHGPNNMQLAHVVCNQKKGAEMPLAGNIESESISGNGSKE
jgi:5-methylcytosine-specific restriction endonuclease McrA